MNIEEIKKKIDKFSNWHYEFDLKGIKTPINDKTRINRHKERKKYFFDPLVEFCGGSFKGKRILDLGCNAGYWSLNALNSGCDYILGVDGRYEHVEQSKFVLEATDIDKDRYDIEFGNIFDFDFFSYGKFDIVFCFGLLYHINRPINMLEIISNVNTDLLIIDTKISSDDDAKFNVVLESVKDYRNSVDYSMVLVPTRKAIQILLEQFKYKSIVLKPSFESYEGAESFENGKRRAFIGAKKSNLNSIFNIETEIKTTEDKSIINRVKSKFR